MILRLTFFLISLFCSVQCIAKESSVDMGVLTLNNENHSGVDKINLGIKSIRNVQLADPVVNLNSESLVASNTPFSYDYSKSSAENTSQENLSKERWESSFRYSVLFFSIVFSLYLALKFP